MQKYEEFRERCPKCDTRLREIYIDNYPEHIEEESIEGFRHRYVCPKCGNEGTFNTITQTWVTINNDEIYHYGKKGNRLLHKTSTTYLNWIQKNWTEIQEEYLEELRDTGQVDGEELDELEEWVRNLDGKSIITHLRQISDELSHPDYGCKSHPAIAAEIILLTERLEELIIE
ncbi:hypothetical protein GF319_04640 [Candidatus Bathyarchaeota archaeon]|nr:hypothetical protein [Candidatus Bathyarchaeota archaeon]